MGRHFSHHSRSILTKAFPLALTRQVRDDHSQRSAAEIATLAPTVPDARAHIAAHYDALLAPFTAGDYGLAEPEVGETRLAVRRRLSAAATRRGWWLDFLPTEGEHLLFLVRDAP